MGFYFFHTGIATVYWRLVRVLKGSSAGQAIHVNKEQRGGTGGMGNYTVYVNPYLVLKSGSYTKHYYIEGQRIVSKLGAGWDIKTNVKAGGDKVDFAGKKQRLQEGLVKNLKFLGADGTILTAGRSGKVPPGQLNGATTGTAETFQYFFHPDHLGSTSYITDASGEVYQHLEYIAFGETFVEEHSNTDRTPYLFNGKELDEETGLYYYGARYYDPRTSIFPSVDPLAENYSFQSSYAYAANNPITFMDYMGLGPTSTHTDIDGNVVAVKDDGDYGVYKHSGNRKEALEAVNKNYSSANTSAGGMKMGETHTPFGFADFAEYERTGNLVPGKGAKIDFNSNWATEQVNGILSSDPSLLEYASKAGTNGVWDLKAHVPKGKTAYFGSKLYGKYASARDAGNFAAGAVSQKSPVPNIISNYGFGLYNQTGNNKIVAAIMGIGDLMVGIASPPVGLGILFFRANFGEDKLSKQGIDAGQDHFRK